MMLKVLTEGPGEHVPFCIYLDLHLNHLLASYNHVVITNCIKHLTDQLSKINTNLNKKVTKSGREANNSCYIGKLFLRPSLV